MQIIKPIELFAFFMLGILYAKGQSQPIPKKSSDTALTKVDSLKAVIVSASARPKMKGDTLEYNTEHILMRTNSAVEDLLRRLPGLQIDAKGTITYNGEKIEHLLVDGEDIFGSDPTLVTRNFDADKIAKVQILDRKSDQAIFTGIDDGTRIKTLNLVLKDGAKNGYFGKLETGGDTGGYYDINGVVAGFRNREQVTVLGFASNTGGLGFSSSGGESSASVSFLNGDVDPLGASAGTGIPNFSAIASHYANSWNGSEDHLSANYQYSHLYTQPITNTVTQQIQPDSVYNQQQNNHSENRQDQHRMYGIYNWVPNARSAFNFSFHLTQSKGDNQMAGNGYSSFNDTLVNSSFRSIHDNVNNLNINTRTLWRVQIGKQSSRILALNFSFVKVDATTAGYLYSTDQFYQKTGQIQSSDTVDQRKEIMEPFFLKDAGVTYSEQLWRNATLGIVYNITMNNEDQLQTTFDRGDGKYEDIIDSLSSHFKLQTVNQRLGVGFQGNIGKFSYAVADDFVGYNFRQQDLIHESTFRLHLNNTLQRISFNYTPNPASFFRFGYNASLVPPSISQLTPTENNSDPLHIALGNPDLKPSLSRTFGFEFRRMKAWLLNFNVNLTIANNTISTKTTTDSLGRQMTEPVNVNGGKSVEFNFSLYHKLLGWDANIHSTWTYSRAMNYVDADLNADNAYTGGGGLNLSRYVADKVSIQLTANFNYFDQVSSINPGSPVHYWAEHHEAMVAIYPIPKFDIGTSGTYTWQEKTNAFGSSTSVLLWSAFISRVFLHDKLVVRFMLDNILNADAGISRTNIDNVNTQSSTNILGRYWMLSAIYHFDKRFKKK